MEYREIAKILESQIKENLMILQQINKYRAEKVKKSSEYQEYIKSQEWQRLRQAYFKEYGYRCGLCGSSRNLHLHHITYENLGQELDADLVPLCQECHKKLHEPLTAIDYLISAEGLAYDQLDSPDEKTKAKAEIMAARISFLIDEIRKAFEKEGL